MKRRNRKENPAMVFSQESSEGNLSTIEKIARTPWIEAAVSIVIGFVFLLYNRQLAEITWVLGVALSFTRYALTSKFQEMIFPTLQLTKMVDILRQFPVGNFQEIVMLYSRITEPEFRRVKDNIVTECTNRLLQLAQEKTSGVLETGEYFRWLFPALESTLPGSQIWAISMMLGIEWHESQVEQNFLDLNLAAVGRGVKIERIFVVRKKDIPNLLNNKYIKAQYDASGEFLKPLVVEREYLENNDQNLLKRLGDGIIVVDNRVALIDISSPEGFRGQVTMNPAEISKLRGMYENLRAYSGPMKQVISSIETT